MALRLPFWLTRVQSRSMEPTLHDGQHAWTTTLRRTDRVRRGDLVVATSVELGRTIIKRVTGLPGEHIEIRNGAVTIDGIELDEPYASPSIFNGTFDVPDGHYLLLGDNRDASSDSRTWKQPFIRATDLAGRIRQAPDSTRRCT